jgi:hypothetical protein
LVGMSLQQVGTHQRQKSYKSVSVFMFTIYKRTNVKQPKREEPFVRRLTSSSR